MKNFSVYVGSFNYFVFAINMLSNCYINTGVCDLEVALFKTNSTLRNDIIRKKLLNWPIYAEINTHFLDRILQSTVLKFLLIVMNPKLSLMTKALKNTMVYDMLYLQNELGDTAIFLLF